jgi:rhodanese-related sulfurtransferase
VTVLHSMDYFVTDGREAINLAVGGFSTNRKYWIVIIMVAFLSSLPLAGSCTQSVPSTTAVATPTNFQSAISPSSAPKSSSATLDTASVPSISVTDALALIQKNKNSPDFIIIDVRTADEYNSGHLADAVNIDYYSPDFKTNISKLDRNKEYLIYCRTGIRGTASTQIMLDLGFNRVYNLSGGIVEWINAGFPTVK